MTAARVPDIRACRISAHRQRQAARVLRRGGIVAHATEGVWGLACDPLDGQAAQAVIALKQRDPGRGLIVVGHDLASLAPFVASHATSAWARAVETWPGPNTWLLPAAPDVPWWLTGGRETIALRQTDHVEARALCVAFGGALVSTSANISAHPPVRNAWQARAVFGDALDLVAGGHVERPGVPSTIRDASDNRLIRGK